MTKRKRADSPGASEEPEPQDNDENAAKKMAVLVEGRPNEGALEEPELETESDDDDDESEGLDLRGRPEDAEDDDSDDEDEDEDEDEDDEDGDLKPEEAVGKDGGAGNGDRKAGKDGRDTVVEAKFDFCTPSDKYFDGMRNLLRDHVGAVPSAVSLTETLLNQCEVTSLVTAPDGDDAHVYALLSALKYKQHDAARHIGDLILKRCPVDEKAAWKSALADDETAVLISARMVNLPMPLAPALYKCFLEDVKWATTTEELSEDERRSFRIARVVCLCPVDIQSSDDNGDSARRKKPATSLKPASDESDKISQAHYFVRHDEEFIVREGKMGFRFTLAAPTSAVDTRPARVFYAALVDWDKFTSAVSDIDIFSASADIAYQVEALEGVPSAGRRKDE